jgi:hypothetical protein
MDDYDSSIYDSAYLAGIEHALNLVKRALWK